MNYQFENTIEELYSCLPNNRKKFNSIMDSMKRRFLRIDLKNFSKKGSTYSKTMKNKNKRTSKILFSNRQIPKSPTKINDINKLLFKKNEPNINQNIQNNNINNFDFRSQRNYFLPKKQEINDNKYGHRRSMSIGFQGTLPDALLINPRPLRTNSKQKILMDTHANCNLFFPERNLFYGTDNNNTGNGWHNQANNIMYNTNENFYNINNK